MGQERPLSTLLDYYRQLSSGTVTVVASANDGSGVQGTVIDNHY